MVSLLGGFVSAAQTVQWRQQLVDDGEGPRWADAVSVTGCRKEPLARQVQLGDGRVVLLTARVFIPGSVPVVAGDQVDGRRVELVDTPVWFDGTAMHHEVRTS